MNSLGDVDATKPNYKIQSTIRITPSLQKEFKKIAQREGRTMSEIIIGQLEEYIKIHGSGNPVFKLDNWSNPGFKMTPAFGGSLQSWDNYLNKCNHKEVEEHYYQAQALLHKITKKEKELARER